MVDFAKQGSKGGEILREPTDTKQKVTKPGSKLMGAHDYKLNAGNSYSLNAGKGRSGSAHTDGNWATGVKKKPGDPRMDPKKITKQAHKQADVDRISASLRGFK